MRQTANGRTDGLTDTVPTHIRFSLVASSVIMCERIFPAVRCLGLNKSAFGLLRTLTTWHCPHSPTAAAERWPSSSRPMSRVRRADSSKPAAVGLLLLLWSYDGTDRRTDTVPLHRHCFAYCAGSVSNRNLGPNLQNILRFIVRLS